MKWYKGICEVCGTWFDIEESEDYPSIYKCDKCRGLSEDSKDDELYDEDYFWEDKQ